MNEESLYYSRLIDTQTECCLLPGNQL